MKLTAIFARDVKPLKLVQIDKLSDVVVVAGPNGVGKTRLVTSLIQHIQNLKRDQNFYITVKATNDVEKSDWGKDTITTNDDQEQY
jgi:ABC-type cobalamin/Fe3+-siderophores transport system ATPase subunit